jgi:hypothetical protein
MAAPGTASRGNRGGVGVGADGSLRSTHGLHVFPQSAACANPLARLGQFPVHPVDSVNPIAFGGLARVYGTAEDDGQLYMLPAGSGCLVKKTQILY